MRRGLWIAVCAMVLCACGCGANTDKTADKTQGTSGEQEAFSPIAAKDVSKVDTEAEYPYEIAKIIVLRYMVWMIPAATACRCVP